ncbi:unnamed protein product [Spirodela intermedia]|uniref:Uncharacterized protein n=1 Tax=Spirodela intermedia TaxID=51605 RepID=A0A7I8KPJ9_SPIIN|nr:unnamed protein product [Spirodela intermedia]
MDTSNREIYRKVLRSDPPGRRRPEIEGKAAKSAARANIPPPAARPNCRIEP